MCVCAVYEQVLLAGSEDFTIIGRPLLRYVNSSSVLMINMNDNFLI